MSEHRGSGPLARAAMPLLLLGSLALLAGLLQADLSPGLADSAPSAPPARRGAAPAPVARYVLQAELDPARHTLQGSGTVTFTNVSSAPLDHLFFHLYLNAFESDRTVFFRGQGRPFRGGTWAGVGRVDVTRLSIPGWSDEDLWPHAATSPDDPDDRTDIRVPLPRPVAPGETIQLALAWTSTLPPLTLRTGFAGSFHMAGQWFPKLAKLEPGGAFAHFPFERMSEFYADFSDWDVTIVAPRAFVVGATGAEVDPLPGAEDGAHRFVQQSVHDFAFVAWDGFRELREKAAGVELRCLFPSGYEEAARLQLEVARRGLALMGDRYGAYPFATLTLVHPPKAASDAGGMEYPTLITTGGAWWGPLTGARTTELVTIHELGHQWFQGLVASNERDEPFLDEGLTSFAETDAMDALVPPGSSASLALGLPIATDAFYRTRGIEPAHRAVIAQPARAFEDGADYGNLVYSRTVTLLRTLDRAYDGDLRRALGVYARRYRFRHPTAEDLLRVVTEEAGQEAGLALRRGLFERGTIDVAIRGVTSIPVASGRYDVSVEVARSGTIVLPVDVEVVDVDGHALRARWDGHATSATLVFETRAPARFVQVDPERKLLLDDDLLNGVWADRPAPPIAGRTLGTASFLARAALGWLGP